MADLTVELQPKRPSPKGRKNPIFEVVQAAFDRELADENTIEVTLELVVQVCRLQDERVARRLAEAAHIRLKKPQLFEAQERVWAKVVYGLYRVLKSQP